MTFPIQLGVKSEPNFREKRVVLSMVVSWDYYHYGSLVLSFIQKEEKIVPSVKIGIIQMNTLIFATL